MINLSGFIDIDPPQATNNFNMRVDSNNVITLSDSMKRNTAQKSIQIMCSDTGNQIAVIPSENGRLKIKSNGKIDTKNISEFLKSKKIKLPAKYTAEWDKDSCLWLCTYSGDYILRKPANREMPRAKKREWQALQRRK